MAREAEKDPAFFASISGKLDAIEHFNVRCKTLRLTKWRVSLCLFCGSIITVK